MVEVTNSVHFAVLKIEIALRSKCVVQQRPTPPNSLFCSSSSSSVMLDLQEHQSVRRKHSVRERERSVSTVRKSEE